MILRFESLVGQNKHCDKLFSEILQTQKNELINGENNHLINL